MVLTKLETIKKMQFFAKVNLNNNFSIVKCLTILVVILIGKKSLNKNAITDT